MLSGGTTKENCASACEENAECTVWQHKSTYCLLFKSCNQFVPEIGADPSDIYLCTAGQPEPGEKRYIFIIEICLFSNPSDIKSRKKFLH